MPRLGIVAPSKEFELLFDTFDPDGSGAIDMKELQKGLRRKSASPEPAKEPAKKVAAKPPTLQEKMIAELKKTLQKKMRVLQVLFKEWDEDGSGSVNRREWHKAMPVIGIQTTKDMLDVLFDAFDEDGS